MNQRTTYVGLSRVAISIAFFLAPGCKEDDDDDGQAMGTTGSGGDTGDDDTGDTDPDPPGDSGSTEGGEAGTDESETGAETGVVVEPWVFDDIFGTANLDDDDGSGEDFLKYPYEGDDDIATLVFTAAQLAELAGDDTVRLVLEGDTEVIRLWSGETPIVGHSAESNTYEFSPSDEDIVFEVEFGDYNAAGTLVIYHLSDAGAVVRETSIVLRAAPLILNHHLQDIEQMWVVAVQDTGYSNASMIATYQDVLGDRFTAVPGPTYGWDVWIQDEVELAAMRGENGQRLDVVIDSIRDRGLDPFAEDYLEGSDFAKGIWGTEGTQTSYDSFGNLEASPPVTVDGVEYPFGRVYYGRHNNVGLNSTLANFLITQEVQAPFELDTTWLCVGHVDEFSSFVPDATAPQGFRLVLADVPAGIALLESLPGNFAIPRFGQDHGYATVDSMLNSASLMALNEDIQADYVDVIREQFKSNLGLTDDEIIFLPSLWLNEPGCGAAALVPGMVNLIVAESDDETTHIFSADPFFRPVPGSQDGDPFIDAFDALMPEGLQMHYVDDWNVYHMALGEVHCGTNAQRPPLEEWWNVAAHLLGGV